jgi:hypothetical protein
MESRTDDGFVAPHDGSAVRVEQRHVRSQELHPLHPSNQARTLELFVEQRLMKRRGERLVSSEVGFDSVNGLKGSCHNPFWTFFALTRQTTRSLQSM